VFFVVAVGRFPLWPLAKKPPTFLGVGGFKLLFGQTLVAQIITSQKRLPPKHLKNTD
jgi:hypothetical protein